MVDLSARAFAPDEEVGEMMFGYGSHWVFWQVVLMALGMFAFWGLLIWAVVALVTTSSRRPSGPAPDPDARRILDARLARGEIEVEEYRLRREAIGSDSQSLAGSSR